MKLLLRNPKTALEWGLFLFFIFFIYGTLHIDIKQGSASGDIHDMVSIVLLRAQAEPGDLKELSV